MQKVKWGIGAKIVLGYCVIILFLAFSILLVSSRMTSLQREIDHIAKLDVELGNLTHGLEQQVLLMESSQRSYMASGDSDDLVPYTRGTAAWERGYNELRSLVGDDRAQLDMLADIKELIERWIAESAQPGIVVKQQGDARALAEYFERNDGQGLMDEIRARFVEFNRYETEQTEKRADRLRSQNQWLKIVLVATLFVISVAAIFIASGISSGIVRTINEVIAAIREIASSEQNLTRRIDVGTSDEISDLAHATNKLLDNVGEMQWTSRRHAEIVSMHQGISDLHALAESFVEKLSEMVGAACAVLYIRSVDERDTVLTREAAYALRAEGAPNAFRLGEGLVGQAAKENRSFTLDHVPNHHFKIVSALGETAPTALHVAPTAFEGKVVAVMELASFRPFAEAEKQLVARSLETLGARINDVLSRMEIEKLLKESQSLARELQAQSEEMHAQQEELLVTNERLAEQNRLAKEKSAQLERIQSELEEYAEQLKISSRYKSEFLANISHELRTPLNGMLILSQMLAENSSGNLDADEQKYASVIHAAGEELLGLINDILDLSKVEAGKLDIVMEEMSVAELIDLMSHQFAKTAEQKGLGFRLELDPACPPFVTTDEQRLHQIVRNLLSNAFKFTEEGEVVLAIRPAPRDDVSRLLPLHTEGIVLAISVTDTGIGIPQDKQGLIFEAFQQADGTTSRKYGGTGLGLSISRELAALLGGCITVESEVGKGSTFTLFIPSMSKERAEAEGEAAAYAEEAGAASAGAPNRIGGRTVLIVDDDERNLYALSQTLIREGLRVVTARNGRQGIDKLYEEPGIDLVLMDIMMPVMDGYAAIREIRANPEFRSLPIIAITAKAMKQDRDQSMEAGASDYVSKPIDPKQLLSLLHVWLTRQELP